MLSSYSPTSSQTMDSTGKTSSPNSIHTKSSSCSTGSLNPKPKFSLFPPPATLSEVIDASIPHLIAARTLAGARSLPNFRGASSIGVEGAKPGIRAELQAPRAVSNPETSLKQVVGKTSQQEGYKRDRSFPFKKWPQSVKRFISKKTSTAIRSPSPETERGETGERDHSISSRSSDRQQTSHMANGNRGNSEDHLSKLVAVKATQKVIRRMRSEAELSRTADPTTPTKTFKISSARDIGPPPQSLPPTPEYSPHTLPVRQMVTDGKLTDFPIRSVSLGYSVAMPAGAALSQESGITPNNKNRHLVSNQFRPINTSSDDSLSNFPDSFTMPSKVRSDPFSKDCPVMNSHDTYKNGDSESVVYDYCLPSDSESENHHRTRYTLYPYSESLDAMNNTPGSFSPRSSKFSGDNRFSGTPQVNSVSTRSLSETPSPKPKSEASEHVPRGILDTFIESLAHPGSGNPRIINRRPDPRILQELEGNAITVARKKLAAAIARDEVLDFSTIVALADLLLQSLEPFTMELWQETQKVTKERQVLIEKRDRLNLAIGSATQAWACLEEERAELQNEHENVVKMTLRLAEIFEGGH